MVKRKPVSLLFCHTVYYITTLRDLENDLVLVTVDGMIRKQWRNEVLRQKLS